jgi:hypothetical protein
MPGRTLISWIPFSAGNAANAHLIDRVSSNIPHFKLQLMERHYSSRGSAVDGSIQEYPDVLNEDGMLTWEAGQCHLPSVE